MITKTIIVRTNIESQNKTRKATCGDESRKSKNENERKRMK